MNGDNPQLKSELEAGVPVDWHITSKENWTPLCLAIYYEAWKAVQGLLEYGADIADVLEEERFPTGFKEVAEEARFYHMDRGVQPEWRTSRVKWVDGMVIHLSIFLYRPSSNLEFQIPAHPSKPISTFTTHPH